MAPLTAWLPARSNQDFDLVIKIVGPAASGLVKDCMLIAKSLIPTGLSVMMQRGWLNEKCGDYVLSIRLAARPFYSMGHGCDVLVHVSHTTPECRRFGLQPGSVLLWEPPPEQRTHPILSEGVIAYPVPLKQLCFRHGEGLQGKALAALGILLHLLGVSEATLCRWTPSLSAPRSFAAGHDYARHDIEKRDAYSLPLPATKERSRMMLTPEQAILLGYAVSACDCRAACDAELIVSPGRWAAKHLGIAGSMVSVLESDSHPGVQVYRGLEGKVMVWLWGEDSSIASCLNGFKAPRVFVAADIPDTFNLIMVGHDLVRNGLCDGVGVLIDETIAQRQQSADVHSLVDMIRRRTTVVSDTNVPDPSDSVATMAEWDRNDEADVGFVAWGVAQGVVRDGVALCRSFGLRVAGLYPRQIVPFHHDDIESFAKTVGRVVIVESGQTQGYWDRLRTSFSFDYATLSPQQGQLLTPMDIFLREGLGAV